MRARRPPDRAHRGARLRQRNLVPVVETGARRASLPRAGRLSPNPRIGAGPYRTPARRSRPREAARISSAGPLRRQVWPLRPRTGARGVRLLRRRAHPEVARCGGPAAMRAGSVAGRPEGRLVVPRRPDRRRPSCLSGARRSAAPRRRRRQSPGGRSRDVRADRRRRPEAARRGGRRHVRGEGPLRLQRDRRMGRPPARRSRRQAEVAAAAGQPFAVRRLASAARAGDRLLPPGRPPPDVRDSLGRLDARWHYGRRLPRRSRSGARRHARRA